MERKFHVPCPFEFTLCSSCNGVYTKCSILHFSVSWYCNTFAATAYDQHIRMYIFAHTYVYPFQRDLTCTDIFRIISIWSRYIYIYIYISYSIYARIYALLVSLILFFLFHWNILYYYLYLWSLLFAFGRLKYTIQNFVLKIYISRVLNSSLKSLLINLTQDEYIRK